MEDELSLESILGEDEINDLFNEDFSEEDTEGNEKEDNKETAEIDPEELFSGGESESVGSGNDDTEEKEDTLSDKAESPQISLYSSIAKALKEEGIFPDLEDSYLKEIKAPDDFANMIEQQVQNRLDEKQRRIDEALNAGMEVSDIKKHENVLNYLDSLDDDVISDESEKGENLRKQLIYQDFINRGYSKERAEREVHKSFDAGTDIEDAKESLLSNKEFFNEAYDKLIAESKAEIKKAEEVRAKQASDLKKSILEDEKIFGDLQVDDSTRKKIYENISKPVYKDPKTGELYTAIQKYEMDNKVDFLKNLGLVFTLTNGFKDLGGLIKGKVKKEVSKGLRELESTLNSTMRTSDGNLKFVSGVGDDPESLIGKGWKLDV